MDLIKDALLDAGIDTLKLIPFLFVTYLVMEALERRTSEKSADLIASAGKLGPVFGGLVGIVPQCGFSAAASSLYAGGIISIGTLLAVFLSTSDEMLPILIASGAEIGVMAKILFTKALIGIVSGLAFDGFLRFTKYKYKTEKRIHDLCEQEHCGCEEEEGGILHSALIHTLHIVVFVFIITFVLTLVIEWIGADAVASILTGKPVIGVVIAAVIGLIPNCASSVMITQLYLDSLLGSGPMMAGLLVSAGVGLLVLFRTNRHAKENFKIAAVLLVMGIFWGLVIEALGVRF